MRIIDRYIIRQVLMPFGIGLLVFTFIFIIEALRRYVEPLVAKGVALRVLATVLATLIPQALALSIPMALLLGLLVAFGRLSSDREFVAMQACGVSLKRLLIPVGVVSALGWAATSYVMFVAVPASNQMFREITFSVIAARAEGEVKPRVLFNDFPNLVLYVREVPVSGGGWNGIFLADSHSGPAAIHLAQHGRVVIDRAARTVEVVLEDGASHTLEGEDYRMVRFGEHVLKLDPATVFPSGGPLKEENEMTIPELRQRIAQNQVNGISTHNQLMAIHRKFAFPVACLVFGVIGLALGATNRRGGAFGSFGFGLVVVFAYYLPTYFFPQMTKGGYLAPWLAVWLPNILLGMAAVVLFLWRNRIADQPIELPVVSAIRRLAASRAGAVGRAPVRGGSTVRLLDWYIGGLFVRTLILSAAAAMAIVYISTFIDLSDKLFKGSAPWYTMAEYFWFATPQFAYYTLPIAVLIATLVTIGGLTRNSEIIVIKACGVSLYRTALPMLACAALVGATLFLMDASILGPANRRAEDLRDLMKGAVKLQPLSRPWLVGQNGTIYHVGGYDPQRHRFAQIDIYEFGGGMSRLVRRTFAASGTYANGDAPTSEATWQLVDGWTREFDDTGEVRPSETFASTPRRLEPVSYFAQEPPDERFMSLAEFRGHTERLRLVGFDVAEYEVGVARKIAYPFVCLIMTLVAIPFATTIGRSGTMAGIAVGIAVALVYWGAINISAALGAGGLLAPTLAAWAPNMLFGAGAVYLLLTVKT